MHRKNNRLWKNIRLKGWDYRNAGAYFVTICTHNKACTLGEIVDGNIRLNDWGQIVIKELKKMERLRDHVLLDQLICMPNHLHFILWIISSDQVGVDYDRNSNVEHHHGLRPESLGAIVRGFKSAVTREINLKRSTKKPPIWQKRFYDRIIRNERELDALRQYIQANPSNWKHDRNAFHHQKNWD